MFFDDKRGLRSKKKKDHKVMRICHKKNETYKFTRKSVVNMYMERTQRRTKICESISASSALPLCMVELHMSVKF